MTTSISTLNTRHGIPGCVTFKQSPGGLALIEVENSQAGASLALQGAQVLTWAPKGQSAVIWLSEAAKFAPGKSLRGGVPVCWPWFGPHASEPNFPAHGYARTTSWAVVSTAALSDGRTRLVFELPSSEATRTWWPHDTALQLQITVGATLEMDLVTRNNSPASVEIGQALHTYFQVSDVRKVEVHGLEGCAYLDKVDGGLRKHQHASVTIAAEVDRIYLDTAADCLIEDPGLQRRIRIAKRGSRATVVWNPWLEKANKMGDLGDDGYLNMLCVESANAADDVVTLAPNEEHHLWVRYSVETMS